MYAIIFEDGTIAHVEEVQAKQDGEWKRIAFSGMLRKCHMTIVEDGVVRKINPDVHQE